MEFKRKSHWNFCVFVFALELWAVVRFVLPAVLRKITLVFNFPSVCPGPGLTGLPPIRRKHRKRPAGFRTSMSFLSSGGSHFLICASGRLPFVILTCRQRRVFQ